MLKNVCLNCIEAFSVACENYDSTTISTIAPKNNSLMDACNRFLCMLLWKVHFFSLLTFVLCSLLCIFIMIFFFFLGVCVLFFLFYATTNQKQ